MLGALRSIGEQESVLSTGSIRVLGAAVIVFAAVATTRAEDALAPDAQLFRQIYRELVEINTTDSAGDTLRAAEAMAARLRAGGVPAADIKVLSSGPRKGNLVARLRGTGARRPLLLLAHLDVVEAKREDWDFDPFELQEANGYFRGQHDRLCRSGLQARARHHPRAHDRRGALGFSSQWLLQHHRDLIDAEFALNEGG